MWRGFGQGKRLDSLRSQKNLSSHEQEHQLIRQAAVGVLSLRRAPKLGKLLVCFASIRSSCYLRPHRTERGLVRRPHRCSWISFPRHLWRAR